jgi:hypothetical protein
VWRRGIAIHNKKKVSATQDIIHRHTFLFEKISKTITDNFELPCCPFFPPATPYSLGEMDERSPPHTMFFPLNYKNPAKCRNPQKATDKKGGGTPAKAATSRATSFSGSQE